MQRFVFLASEIKFIVPRVCQATSSCAMVLRMFYHGHYRVAIYCTGDLLLERLWWDTTGVLETAEFTLANQQKIWINPWQLGLVSPDSDRNSMKFLSEDGFCEIQDDEVSRFHCFSAVGDPRLLFAEQILFGWSWMISTCTSRANDFLALFQSCSNRATFQASQEVLCPLDPNVTDNMPNMPNRTCRTWFYAFNSRSNT